MKELKAYHGSPEIKAKYLARVRRHREADELIKGQYWRNGKGCAVGCTLEERFAEARHAAYETDLGIPVALARLEDSIFEGLPNAAAQAWPERFLSAIQPGADLSGVADQFVVLLMATYATAAKAGLAYEAAAARIWQADVLVVLLEAA